MLAWLKRRARVTTSINLLRRHLPSDMFVSEPVQSILTPSLKLVVVNNEGQDFSLEVPPDMTVERVKKMALGHFYDPAVATGGDERGSGEGGKTGGERTYRLVLVREARSLNETNSLHLEQLLDYDELLLVKRRPAPQLTESPAQVTPPPTLEQILDFTTNLVPRNTERPQQHPQQPVDFQIEFRRILVTMIEASVRLISADPDSEDVFNHILEKLERRHKPQVDRNSLKQLTDMGFAETKATKALQVKRNVREAAEWLLEQNSQEDGGGDDYLLRCVGGEGDSSTTTDNSHIPTTSNTHQDPAERVLNTFLQYRKKWFQPNPQALGQLTSMGFSEQQAIDALRATGNKLLVASNLLLNGMAVQDTKGLERDSPIISAILASPVIQLALPKPKTLLALMMLYESPNNANMWLSDPDTHPVVSQVIRIYHAEKHSLGRPPPPDTTVTARDSPNHSSTTSSTLSQPTLLPTTATFTPVYLSRGQSQTGHPFMISIRNSSGVGGAGTGPVGTVGASWLGGSPIHRASPSVTPPRTQPTPPATATVLRPNLEEPMSHSGSPIRRPQGNNVAYAPAPHQYQMDLSLLGQEFVNSPPVTLEDPPSSDTALPVTLASSTSTDHLHPSALITCTTTNLQDQNTRPSPATLSNDVEMDDTVGDSQDMDTQ
ncbi:hypothetical protein Pmani_013411 [Petrolisthes manimaculis]|uniref:UBA domain-containing protein n=1 Tax=Petrolisthes manimaculis TaxID=1843537 RepID=A0AAE1PYI9_9EUCA|nr:hypothetical protein Pmani_013411 [Petrolisthes manimaculis]